MSRGPGTCRTGPGNGGDPGLLMAVRSGSHVHGLGGLVCSRSSCSAGPDGMVFCGTVTVRARGSLCAHWSGVGGLEGEGAGEAATRRPWCRWRVGPWRGPAQATACPYVADQKQLSSACF